MKRGQFRTGNAQIVGGIKDDGLIKLPGVEGDFRETRKQQRIGDQPQVRMESEGGMAPNAQAVRASTSAGLASEALLPPMYSASRAKSA
ncbi:Uncharacterised protein [Klebsiella grimontii]|uniref:Uncharacterized protein n=1 Tax=Klebsiella grimontii TaxID=2058152 RepID=A0A7H4P5K6_9ENTR|nr:Uncharacterised protein [Klebsiella grimontii]